MSTSNCTSSYTAQYTYILNYRYDLCNSGTNLKEKQNTSHHVSSYDFLEDRTERGNKLGIPVVIDEFIQRCHAIRIAPSIPASAVVGKLECLLLTRGVPQCIGSGNGSEFAPKGICQ